MLRLAALILYIAMIFTLSSIPGATNGGGASPLSTMSSLLSHLLPLIQNLLHLPLYGGLAICLLRALSLVCERVGTQIKFTLIFSLAIAVADEYYQNLISGRTASYTDVVLDLAGACLAVFLLYIWRRKRTNLQNKSY